MHRVGRTGRAGRGGWALSLVTQHDVQLVHAIEALVGHELQPYEVDEADALKGLSKVRLGTTRAPLPHLGGSRSLPRAWVAGTARRDTCLAGGRQGSGACWACGVQVYAAKRAALLALTETEELGDARDQKRAKQRVQRQQQGAAASGKAARKHRS